MDYTTTITGVTYEGSRTIETTSPLGEKLTQTIELDWLLIEFEIPAGTPRAVRVRPEAVANRMVGYELATEEEALESLVRELVFGWAPALQPLTATRAAELGGADARIPVKWKAAAAKTKARKVLDGHRDRLKEAHDRFTERERGRRRLELEDGADA